MTLPNKPLDPLVCPNCGCGLSETHACVQCGYNGHRQQQSIDQFLAEIQLKRNINRCWQQGCNQYVQAHGRFEMPSGDKEFRLCMEHFKKAHQFVIQISKKS